MLEATSVYDLNAERIVNNSWSELFVATGGTVPNKPPPIWKSCILTVIPLHMFVWNMGGPLTTYLLAADIDPDLATFLTIVCMVSLVSYVGVPVMHKFFGEWLNMPRRKSGKFKHLKYIKFIECRCF